MEKDIKSVGIVLFTNLGVGAGTEVVAEKLSAEFVRLGYFEEVSIIQTNFMGFSDTNDRIGFQKRDGVNFKIVKSPLEIALFRKLMRSKPLQVAFGDILYTLLYAILNLRKIRQVSKNTDFLIFMNATDAWSWFLFGGKTTNYVITGERGFPDKRILLNALNKHADGVHFLTKKQMDSYNLLTHNAFTIPNGVNGHVFMPKSSNDLKRKTRFIFASRLEKNKGIGELIQSIKSLVGQKFFEFYIAGAGSYEKELENGSEEGVQFVGHMNQGELAKLFQTGDVFVFPSYGETFGNVVIEAVSSGLFVLASDSLRGNFDDLESIGALKYVDINPENLAKEISALIGFRLDLKKKEFFHEYVTRHYDWAVIAEKWYKNISKLRH